MTFEDLLNQETDANNKINKAHNEIWLLKRIREMESVRDCSFEDKTGCGSTFKEVATECLGEIKWVLKKQLYVRIQNAISEATASYTTYRDMCKECNLEPKKFNLDFSYEID